METFEHPGTSPMDNHPGESPAAVDAETNMSLCFKLANGYVELAEPPSHQAAPATQPDSTQEKQAAAGKRTRAFWFHNRQMTEEILLYGNQVASLIEELPKAYAAHQRADYSYRFELSKTKAQMITLEVVLFKDRTFLFLKKYFKPSFNQIVDESSEWLPTRAVITLDPLKDNPQALLKFVLSAHRRAAAK